MITIEVPTEHEQHLTSFCQGFSDAWWVAKGDQCVIQPRVPTGSPPAEAAYAAGQAAYRNRISVVVRDNHMQKVSVLP